MKILIPKVFYDDHESRDLPTPKWLGETVTGYYIDSEDPAYAELLHDARHYAEDGCDCEYWLKRAARALVNRIEQAAAL